MKSKRNQLIFTIVFCSIMAALSIVLEKFLSFPKGSSYLKFTLYGLPLMVTGIFFGKLPGTLSGVVSGTILQLTSEWGISIMSIFWALAPIAWGFFSGLLSDIFKKNLNLPKIILIVFTCSICSFLLNTLTMIIDSSLYADSYYTASVIIKNLPPRLISMLILLIAYSGILFGLYKSLKKIMIFENNDEKTDDI